MESVIKIVRLTEFYQGYIRFKIAITNESPYVITDVTLDFLYDENLLYIPKIEENNVYPIINGKFALGNIYGKNTKTFTVLFEPLACSKAADIECQINYANYEGRMVFEWMEPKEINIVCPLLKSAPHINFSSLKYLIEQLPTRASRVFEIHNNFDLKRLEILSRGVLDKHDVQHIGTLHTQDGTTCEIWYYGKTMVTKDDIVIEVSILFKEKILELFAATQDAEMLTGLLAEMGHELKDTTECISGKEKSSNLTIKDSVVQRSNLLDMCNLDSTCDANVIIENSVVQRSNIATVDEVARLRQEKEGIEKHKLELEHAISRASVKFEPERHIANKKGISPFDLVMMPVSILSSIVVTPVSMLSSFVNRFSRKHVDCVNFTLTAPSVMALGRDYEIAVWAYLEEQQQEILEDAKKLHETDDICKKSKRSVPIERKTSITVLLDIPAFKIDDSKDTIYWDGKVANTTFMVTIPENISFGEYKGKLLFLVEGLQVARLDFKLNVGTEERPVSKIPANLFLINRAFASYSSEDRDAVIYRIQGIKIINPKIDVFIDAISLRPGELWYKRIKEEIENRDIFYLFWSEAASKSPWVEKEWRIALESKGIEFISPVPLVSPEKVKPPEELAELHFNDWLLAYIREN